MKYCINGGNVIKLLSLSAKLLKFEIQKCGQILCAHKPYFLMPGHICDQVWENRSYPYILYFEKCLLEIFNALSFSCGTIQSVTLDVLY